MNEHPAKEVTQADKELEREIRAGRKFTLEEAIGRMAGPGAMKGVSPVTRLQQAEIEIFNWLTKHVADPAGALKSVLHRSVKESAHLLQNTEEPLAVLSAVCQHILASDYLLTELVRQADFEWSQVMGERPHFEKPGHPPHPDDPYSKASVAGELRQVIQKLSAGVR